MRSLVVFLALMLPAPAALAQPAQQPPAAPARPLDPPEVVIARADANKDGVSSRQEWVAIGNHDAGFTAIDVDKDGKVTVEELKAFRARTAARAAQAGAAAR